MHLHVLGGNQAAASPNAPPAQATLTPPSATARSGSSTTARRPTIVYDWGALPELVVQGQTGFVVPFRDVDAVVEKLKFLHGNRDVLRAMGLKA